MEDEQVKQVIDIAICGERYTDQTYSDKVCKYFKLCNPNTPITAEEQSQTQQQANKEMLRLTNKFKASS